MKPGQQKTEMKEKWKIENQIRESLRIETVKKNKQKREQEKNNKNVWEDKIIKEHNQEAKEISGRVEGKRKTIKEIYERR
jgi:hypothetical protein